MQLRFATDLSAREYVRGEAWKKAKLERCPLHPEGGCGFRKNGTYPRKYPEGTRIARISEAGIKGVFDKIEEGGKEGIAEFLR